MDIIQSSEKVNSVNSGTSYSMNLELLAQASAGCSPTRSACSAPTTRTRSRPATTSRPGPASAGTREALRLFAELLPDQERVLGRDHPDTLTTRNNIAVWTGECGDAREALRLFRALLPDQERVLGRDHPETLTTRNNIAAWTGEVRGRAGGAAAVHRLLPDQERVLGRDHPDTLTTRNNIASWTGECGDAREALRLFAALLPDQERVLGPDHPATLTTRSNIASWTGRCGDARRRCGCSPSCCRTRSGCWAATTPPRSGPATTSRPGPARWETRGGIAAVHRVAAGPGAGAGPRPPRHAQDAEQHRRLDRPGGDAREALRLSRALLPDQERVLGRDHPDTLRTRNNIAGWTGAVGDAREALRLFAELLPDRERVLGRDHPDTLRTRNNIAHWTGRVGDAARGVAAVRRAAAGPGAGAGPRPPRHARTQETIKLLQSAASLSQDERIERSGSLIRRLMSWWKPPPMIGRVGPMRRRSVMGGRREPARSGVPGTPHLTLDAGFWPD